jgi:hypothetical protein
MDIIPAVAGNKPNIITADFIKLVIYNDVNATLATSLTIGNSYQIYSVGTTDWTAVGAADNLPGTIFVATGTGSGDGTAYDVSRYTFSSAYKFETIEGVEYSPMGGFLSIGIQQRDLRATSAQTSISLSGIGGDNIYLVLGTKVQGSIVNIIRGFYDENYNLTSYANRFTGIVTSFNINEDRKEQLDNFTVTINANSFKTVLENRVTGRKTNRHSWQVVAPADSSMNNVDSIAGQWFDFGVSPGSTVSTGGVNPSGSGLQASLIPASRHQN